MDKEKTKELIQLYVDEKRALLKDFPLDDIAAITEEVWKAYLHGKTIYACGNGGNAGFVSNLINDLSMHPFITEDKSQSLPADVPRLNAVDLCTSPVTITAIMNDLGPDYIFSQQLINYGIREEDIVVGFTGSGNSPNILKAFEVAKNNNAKTIALTRGTGGKAKELTDYCIIVPGTSRYPGQTGKNDNNFHFEDETSTISHMITGIIKQRVTEKYGAR